jgi:3-hydroxyisobutyrate dehydrogenase-like beta-hydroxyacid dehydrogenase
MGMGMAKNLLAAGYGVTGFDLSKDNMDAFVRLGVNL